MTRKMLIYCFTVLALSSSFAWAQQSTPQPTQQPDTAALEQRMKEMEERIIQLEGQVRQLKAENAGQRPRTPRPTLRRFRLGRSVPLFPHRSRHRKPRRRFPDHKPRDKVLTWAALQEWPKR